MKATLVTKSDTAYITHQDRQSVINAAVAATSINLTTDVITKASHGLSNGDVLMITNAGTTDLSLSTPYFIINKATNTFELALTVAGTKVDIGGTDTTAPTYQRISTLTTATRVNGKIYVGGAGVVVALPQSHDDTDDPTPTPGGAVSFTAVAGGLIPIEIKKVFNTSTTATLMICIHD